MKSAVKSRTSFCRLVRAMSSFWANKRGKSRAQYWSYSTNHRTTLSLFCTALSATLREDMSRVRNALKISDVWQPQAAIPSEGRALPLGPSPQTPSDPVDKTVATTPDEEFEHLMQLPVSL